MTTAPSISLERVKELAHQVGLPGDLPTTQAATGTDGHTYTIYVVAEVQWDYLGVSDRWPMKYCPPHEVLPASWPPGFPAQAEMPVAVALERYDFVLADGRRLSLLLARYNEWLPDTGLRRYWPDAQRLVRHVVWAELAADSRRAFL